MAFIVIGIGAAMLAGLGASLMRKGPLVARAHELGDADPDDIARKIAALDDAFEKKFRRPTMSAPIIMNRARDESETYDCDRATRRTLDLAALARRERLV